MRKYLHVLNVGVQNQLVYRANFLFRAVFGLVPLMATIYLWRTIYAGKEDGSVVAGYALGQMISYYVIVSIVDSLTAVNDDDFQIAADIKDGRISQFLLKPIDFLWYRLCLYACGRVIYVAIAAVPMAGFIAYLWRYFVLPADAATVFAFLAATGMAALLQFFISYTMALLAFWVLEVSTFIFILFAFEYVASGQLFPLDILPPAASAVLHWTPFPYELFFPVSVYLGRVTGPALWQGLAIQAVWVALAYGLARWTWSRGVRRYGAVGG